MSADQIVTTRYGVLNQFSGKPTGRLRGTISKGTTPIRKRHSPSPATAEVLRHPKLDYQMLSEDSRPYLYNRIDGPPVNQRCCGGAFLALRGIKFRAALAR
jgi:hypothetical protein